MAYSLDEAKLLLQTTELTQQALINLVQQISVEASGATTIFYGGDLPDGSSATKVIGAMVDAGDDIRVLDKSAAGQFLASAEFKTAAGKASGLSGSQLIDYVEGRLPRMAETEWIFAGDPNTSPWAAASKNFAQATTGDVRLMVSGSGADRIFNQAELPALLQNASVTKTNGYDIDSLKAMYPKAGGTTPNTNKLFEGLKLSSERNILLSGFTTIQDANGSVVSVTKGNLLASDLHDTSYLKSHPEKLQIWADYLKLHPDRVSAFTDFAKLHLESTKTLFKAGGVGALKAAKVLGPIAAILGFGMATAQAAEAESQGNHDQANEIMKLWAIDAGGSQLGSVAGAAIGGIAVAALAVAGVALTAPLAGALVLGATLFGGIYGGEGAAEFYHLLDDRDGNDRRDIVDKLSNLFFGANSTILTPLPADLNGEKFTIDASLSSGEMVAKAKGTGNEGIAWRYALRELNPFVISDVSYAAHNTDGSLDLYNKDTNPGGLTDAYLIDRAAMLTWKLQFDKKGAKDDNDLTTPTGHKPYNEAWDSNTVQGNWDFIDLWHTNRLPGGAPLTLEIDGVGISQYDHQVVFGSKDADTIEGSGDSDRLYGMAGDDTLDGKGGNDYLEGGSGNDSYIFTGSWGKDTVVDVDGKGSIKIGGTTLLGGDATGQANTWSEKLGNGDIITYQVLSSSSSSTGKQLKISKKGDLDNSITITNFDLAQANNPAGYVGIWLRGTVKLAITEGNSGTNFWSDPAATLASLLGKASTFVEGTARAFTIALNMGAKAGDTITLAMGGAGDKFKAILGDTTVPANGAVITLTEGQTEVRISLVETEALTADASATLSATYKSADPANTQIIASNSWGIAVRDAGEASRTFIGNVGAKLPIHGMPAGRFACYRHARPQRGRHTPCHTMPMGRAPGLRRSAPLNKTRPLSIA